MARRSSDEPDAPQGPRDPRDPRYVIRVPLEQAPEEPEAVPVRGGRTEAPEQRPASDYVIRATEPPQQPARTEPPRPPAPAESQDGPGVGHEAAAAVPASVRLRKSRRRHSAEHPPRIPRRRLSRPVRWVLVLGSVVLLAGVAALVVVRAGLLDNPNPFAGRDLYVDPESEAIKAVDAATDAATRDAFLTIADRPAAIWLTPEERPAGEVGPYVAQVVAAAEAEGTLPVFVVYGIPDRDCGQFSAGGTTVDGYETWVREIATALEGTETPVILEPDSVSLAEQCGDVDRRLGLVATAGAALTDVGATVYLDGGHSNWHSVQETADLLRRAGVADVHGFATNVSNYNDDDSEIAYAQRLSAQLGGAPYVVDTGRNGNGSDGTWCNPPGAALGAPPLTLEAEGLDANLWVKPPGESDGTCAGGPVAGEWWPDRALSLVAATR